MHSCTLSVDYTGQVNKPICTIILNAYGEKGYLFMKYALVP